MPKDRHSLLAQSMQTKLVNKDHTMQGLNYANSELIPNKGAPYAQQQGTCVSCFVVFVCSVFCSVFCGCFCVVLLVDFGMLFSCCFRDQVVL